MEGRGISRHGRFQGGRLEVPSPYGGEGLPSNHPPTRWQAGRCLFDWSPDSAGRILKCQERGCKRTVAVWRPGLVEELGVRGLLAGMAKLEWERKR